MKLPRRRFLYLAAGAATLRLSSIARAQAYPSRPITMIVPFAPGGATDVIARSLAERMRITLNQAVVIESVTGAGGTIGVGRVARATPDGYTLSIGQNGSHVANGATYALQFDLLNDFDPVALLSTTPMLLLVRRTMPAKDLKEFIAWLKANPDDGTQGYAARGAPGHLAGLLLQKATGVRFQFVPYRGGALVVQDLVAGQIDLCILDPTTTLPHVRSGSIKAYAVMSKTRLASVPDIPTVDEAGLPGLYASLWHGLWAPKRTPKQVIAKLNTAVVEALDDVAVRARLADLGQEIFSRDQRTPEALAV
jgi:tripartite-type tricarboxylate transporter receptor subunit TctC